jgi:hypothetical protein
MMMRSLVQELVRRRLWPVPLVALLVAIAAPALFLKSAPADAPPASAAPPAPAAGELPARAGGLLDATQKAVTRRHRLKGKGQDPFAPPASGAKSAAAPAKTAAAAAAKAAAASPKAIPVVITNANGSKPAAAPTTTTTTPKATTQRSTAPTTTTTPATAAVKTVTYVDVRFARQMGSMLRYRLPRLQALRAGGRVAAVFVKYSPARHKAVFAIAPSTKVDGDVTCRRVLGVCRYVDIPAGSYARLTMRGEDGRYLSRRLDVVSIRHMPLEGNATPSARTTPLATATCLIKRLLALPAIVPSISSDSCG